MSKTDERLAIPARPAAVTTVNIAALTALGVAATGVGGAILATGALAVGGAAMAKRKHAARRAASTATGKRAPTTPTGTRRTGALGKLAGMGRARKASGSTPSGSGRTAKAGASRNPLARAAGKLTRGKAARAAKTGGATGAARKTSSTGLGKAASTTGRGITKAAKWSAPKMRNAIKRAVTAGASTKPTDSTTQTKRNGKWAKARKIFQSTILRRKPKTKATSAREAVAATVDRRNRPATSTGQCAPMVIIQRAGRPVPLATAVTATPTTGGIAMRDSAKQMWNYAATFEPRGMTPVIQELEDLPETLTHVAAAVGALMEKAQAKFPLDPAIIAQIGQVVEGLYAAAGASKKIPVAVHEIHAAEIKRFTHSRNGEEMWDVMANGRG